MRNVIVTGGGTGIGRATAGWFAGNGDQVFIVGRRAGVLTSTADEIGASAVVGDLGTLAGVNAVVRQLPETVHVLVNNAGGNTGFFVDHAQGTDSALQATAAEWQSNWTANVMTAVLATTALTDRLDNDGRVVSVGSVAAANGSGAYGAAKAALESWTVGLSKQLGRRGITANLVAPGLVEDTEFFNGTLTDERRERLRNGTATKRAGHPDDIAATIGFLASAGARHITGQVIHVNGGAYNGR